LIVGFVKPNGGRLTVLEDIRVIKGPTGLFISFPNRTASDGGQRDIAFPANTETRRMTEQAVLAEYEKIIAPSEAKADAK
jgi:DNA-binding cell septation regulator SpoVG